MHPAKKIHETMLIQMYNLGKSDYEMARHFGVSQGAVTQVRNRLGLPNRYCFPYWRGKNPDIPIIKVDSEWNVIDKYLKESKILVWAHKLDTRYRIWYRKDTVSVWLELKDTPTKDAVLGFLKLHDCREEDIALRAQQLGASLI